MKKRSKKSEVLKDIRNLNRLKKSETIKPVQYFSEEYLEQCRKMSITDRLQFLEDFRQLQDRRPAPKSRLISLRMDEVLLERLKEKAKAEGLPYQTLLKNLVRDYLARN